MKPPKLDFETMIQRAADAVTSLNPEEVRERNENPKVLLVDIRDVRELEREGRIPGSKHVPQGMLEFWMHPQSPYYKDYFDGVEEVILHCNKGWRSALAAHALQQIGIEVTHMSGGYSEWAQKKFPTVPYERKPNPTG
jgi:rhodanese-related sulfurtransferase